MFKKILITLTLTLCLVMNSIVAFAAQPENIDETTPNITVIDFESQDVMSARARFYGTFSGGYCTITGIPNEGGANLIYLKNVPGKNITCKISGNSNLHYVLEYLYQGFPALTYKSNEILGNGSITSTTVLGSTGDYLVSVSPYSGYLNGKTLTLVFHAW